MNFKALLNQMGSLNKEAAEKLFKLDVLISNDEMSREQQIEILKEIREFLEKMGNQWA